ncbi:superoxide dismutase [[Clostridium] cellulosi]|jgi:Iron/manganese superoxide dismutases, alpha-hairpin domain./Iron/manganese superoxide dismutases, C-terminal domain.
MDFTRLIEPGGHTLPPLPYAYNALEPIISADSLRIHHDILHKNYVDGLNRAELNLVDARRDNNFELIKYWENELAYNGSGHILHSIFWAVMSPVGKGGEPGNITLSEIINYFGSFDAFKEQFSNAANKIEGSYWAILTWQPTWHRLEILQAEKHQNKTQWSGIPILVLDVWEHAYYLDYKTHRDEYIQKWWQLVNWEEVESRLKLAMNGEVKLTI